MKKFKQPKIYLHSEGMAIVRKKKTILVYGDAIRGLVTFDRQLTVDEFNQLMAGAEIPQGNAKTLILRGPTAKLEPEKIVLDKWRK